jgi:prepilin-type N-terminal cleavage/methylation domain-containing protein
MKQFIIPKKRKGYTLIELSVVLVLIVMIAGILVSMLSQQVQFYTWWNTQKFIAEDAPLANNIVVRLFAKADTFSSNGSSMTLGFVEADGITRYGVISHAGSTLQYSYNDQASWDIVRGVPEVNFNTVGDTLQFTMTGPYGGQVTYAATPAL